MCAAGFIKFLAQICVYSSSDLLRQQLITESAPGLDLVPNLQMHSVSEGDLMRAVQRWDFYEITMLRKELIT